MCLVLFMLTDVSSAQPAGFAGPPNRLMMLPPPNVTATSLASSSGASSRGAVQQLTFSHLSSGLATIQSSPQPSVQSSGQSSIQQPVWMMPECLQGPGVFQGQQRQPQPELWLHQTNEPVAVQQVLPMPQQLYKVQPAAEQAAVLEVQHKPAARTDALCNHRLFPTETDIKSKQSLPVAAADSSSSADVAPVIAPFCWLHNEADLEDGNGPVRPKSDGREDLASGSFCPPIPDFIPRDSVVNHDVVHKNDASDYIARNMSHQITSQESHSSESHEVVLESSSQEVGPCFQLMSSALFYIRYDLAIMNDVARTS